MLVASVLATHWGDNRASQEKVSGYFIKRVGAYLGYWGFKEVGYFMGTVRK